MEKKIYVYTPCIWTQKYKYELEVWDTILENSEKHSNNEKILIKKMYLKTGPTVSESNVTENYMQKTNECI